MHSSDRDEQMLVGGAIGDIGYIEDGTWTTLERAPFQYVGRPPLLEEPNSGFILQSSTSSNISFTGDFSVLAAPVGMNVKVTLNDKTFAFLAPHGGLRSTRKSLPSVRREMIKWLGQNYARLKAEHCVNVCLIHKTVTAPGWQAGFAHKQMNSAAIGLTANTRFANLGSHGSIENQNSVDPIKSFGPPSSQEWDPEDPIGYTLIVSYIKAVSRSPFQKIWQILVPSGTGVSNDLDTTRQASKPGGNLGVNQLTMQEPSSSETQEDVGIAMDHAADRSLLDDLLEQALQQHPEVDTIVGDSDLVKEYIAEYGEEPDPRQVSFEITQLLQEHVQIGWIVHLQPHKGQALDNTEFIAADDMLKSVHLPAPVHKVEVIVECANGLERGADHLPTSFAVVFINGNCTLTTQTIVDNCDPYWNESCDIDMSPETVVAVEVRDEHTWNKDDPQQGSLGTMVFRLEDVVDFSEEGDQQIVKRTLSPLYEGHHVRGTITVVLRKRRPRLPSPPIRSIIGWADRSDSPVSRLSSSSSRTTSSISTDSEVGVPTPEDSSIWSETNWSKPTLILRHDSEESWMDTYNLYPAGAGVDVGMGIPMSVEGSMYSLSDTSIGVPHSWSAIQTTLDLGNPLLSGHPSWSRNLSGSHRSTDDRNPYVAHRPPRSMSRPQMPVTDVDSGPPHRRAPGIRARTSLAVLNFDGQALAEPDVLRNVNSQIPRWKLNDTRGTIVGLKVSKTMSPRVDKETLLYELTPRSPFDIGRILPFIGTTSLGYHTILVSVFTKNGNFDNYLQAYPQADRKRLVHQVADAVAFLRQQPGRIHGDLKRQNVLVNDAGDAVLADFGLSTTVDQPEREATAQTGIIQLHTMQFAAAGIPIGNEEHSPPFLPGNRPRSNLKTQQSDAYTFGSLLLQACFGELTRKHNVTEGTVMPPPPRSTVPNEQALQKKIDRFITSADS